jgi:hypothetical protein
VYNPRTSATNEKDQGNHCRRRFCRTKRGHVLGWTLDLFFARDIEQMITLRDVEALSDMARRIRTRRTQLTPNAASSPPNPRFAINSNECESD